MRTIAWAAVVLAAVSAPAASADLQIVKTSAAVSDLTGLAVAHALPGAVVEHAITVTNPNTVLSGTMVAQVQITDDVPAGVALRVADLGAAGGGPVEFADGNLLGTGLAGSNLRYSFKGLADPTDGLEFSDGRGWTYAPPAGVEYDPKVRAIRVTLTRQQAAGSRFRLRYRVVVR